MDATSAFTPTDLSIRFKCDIDSVYALIHSGKLSAFDISKPGSKRATWRISAAAVSDFERGKTNVKPPTKRRRSRAKPAAGFVAYY